MRTELTLSFPLMLALVGCGKPVVQPAPTPVVAVPSTLDANPLPVAPAAAPSDVPAENEALDTEAPEQDPGSATVKLRIEVSPKSAHPVVFWGKQKLGESPVTIERPRRSGPMDVLVTGNGYLDYHTRLFTDRDDRLSVVLVRSSDAVTMLGYKRRPDAGDEPSVADAGSPPEGATPKAATASPGFVVPSGVSF